jgi:hypothetical protein
MDPRRRMKFPHPRAGALELGPCDHDGEHMVPSDTTAALYNITALRRGWVYCRQCGFWLRHFE